MPGGWGGGVQAGTGRRSRNRQGGQEGQAQAGTSRDGQEESWPGRRGRGAAGTAAGGC